MEMDTKRRCLWSDCMCSCVDQAVEFFEHVEVAVGDIGTSCGARLYSVQDALQECADDLYCEIARVTIVYTPEGARENVLIVANSTGEQLGKWRDTLCPGYVANSVLVKISSIEVLVYGMQTFCQPDIAWTCWIHQLGACFAPAIFYAGEWWRCVTPIFLHGSVQHLFMNMFIQLRLGFKTEEYLGASKFTFLYFGSGIIANLASCIFDPIKLSVGASTSVFGLIGANFSLYIIKWPELTLKQKTGFAVYSVLMGGLLFYTPVNVDVIGHTVGFLTGVCLTILLDPKENATTQQEYPHHMVLIKCASLLTLGGVLGGCGWGWYHMPLYDPHQILLDYGIC